MKKTFLFLGLTILSGCTLARVNVEMLSKRTALENQVLGAYNALDTQMLLAASVRGVDTSGRITPPPRHSREFNDVITAMQVIDFYADDLTTFKRLGWAGENNHGLITALEMDKKSIPDRFKGVADRISREEFKHIIDQVNRARETIMRHVIDTNENLTEADLPKIKKVFAKINAENAKPGVKIQSADGTWRLKKG